MSFQNHLLSVVCLGILFSSAVCVADVSETPTIAGQRRLERMKRRNLIVVNDGMDVTTFAKTVEAWDERLKAYLPTQLCVMDFCVSFAGFGKFLYKTAIGDVQLDRTHLSNNLTPELIVRGTDPLRYVLQVFHPAQREVFCSFRMNDTHDYMADAEYVSSSFKKSNPEFLFGKPGDIVPHGRWSGIDYGRREVRDKFCEYVQEVCRNYEIDGVTFNFWRHMPLFKSVAWGKPVSPEEKAGLTDMMRKLRKIADEEGERRKRPILIGLHIPDSPAFCEEQGIELEKWLSEDLADLLYMTEYFRLNKWEKSVEIGKKYGIPVFACLTDARVSTEPGAPFSPKLEKVRVSVEAYRGSAAVAWRAGVHGLYVFNRSHPGFLPFMELGDPELIRFKDKVYFCSWDGGARPSDEPGKILKGGAKYMTLPNLSPNRPCSVKENAPLSLIVEMAEDLAGAAGRGLVPNLTLFLRVPKGADPESFALEFNSCALAGGKWVPVGSPITPFQGAFDRNEKISSLRGEWVEYPLSAKAVAQGDNRVNLALRNQAAPLTIYDLMVRVVYPK
jgi:hypothetical protein